MLFLYAKLIVDLLSYRLLFSSYQLASSILELPFNLSKLINFYPPEILQNFRLNLDDSLGFQMISGGISY